MATIAQIFETREQAGRAIEALRQSGIRAEDISLVVRDRRGGVHAEPIGSMTDATTIGAAGGGLLGGIAGLLVGVGMLAIPGIGPALAAGPIAGLLAGGAVGLGVGGVIGALVDLGIPEEEAHDYQAAIERGGLLVAARVPDGDEPEALAILEGIGSPPLAEHRQRWEVNPDYRYEIEPGWNASTQHSEPARLAESDTSSDAGSGAVLGGAGGALIGGLAAGPVGAAAGAAVGALGGATVAEAIDYSQVEPEFRREWEDTADRNRPTWDRANPAYRHGWESGQAPEHRGRSWDEAHHEIRSAWREGIPWDEAEPLVRRGWEHRTTYQGR